MSVAGLLHCVKIDGEGNVEQGAFYLEEILAQEGVDDHGGGDLVFVANPQDVWMPSVSLIQSLIGDVLNLQDEVAGLRADNILLVKMRGGA